MQGKFVPKLNLRANISETKLDSIDSPIRMENIFKTAEVPEFKEVFTDLVKNVDGALKAPDDKMESLMLGTGADIHDVMVAMTKAELSINIATQMTSKVVQAYEKVMSIQL